MEAWRESWLSDCMAVARKGYEVFDNSWSLSLALENSHLNQLHCAGVSKDRKKFSICWSMTLVCVSCLY